MTRVVPLLLLLAGCATVPAPADSVIDLHGTWSSADSLFFAATDSTPEQHLLYTRIVFSDSTYTQLYVNRTVGDEQWDAGLNAIEFTYPYRIEGSQMTSEFGEDAFTRQIEVQGDTLWFMDELATEKADPLVRQLESAPPVPANLVGVWTDGVVVDDAGVPVFIALEIREDGTLAVDGQEPVPALAFGRFLLLPQPGPDELAPGEIPLTSFDVIPYTLNGDRLTLEFSPELSPIVFRRQRARPPR